VLGVGGGITADSDPDAEWRECLHKAAPITSLSGTSPPIPSLSSAQDRVVELAT
jgi:para-aminobenzoate synthetase component 1